MKNTITKEELEEKLDSADEKVICSLAVKKNGATNLISTFWTDIDTISNFEGKATGFSVALKTVMFMPDGDNTAVEDAVFVSSEDPVESLQKQIQDCSSVTNADKAYFLGFAAPSLAVYPIPVNVYNLLKGRFLTGLMEEFKSAD